MNPRIERLRAEVQSDFSAFQEQLAELVSLDIAHVRPAVLSPESLDILLEWMSFRHFFRHAYAVKLDPARLSALQQLARPLLPALERDMQRLDLWLADLSSARP